MHMEYKVNVIGVRLLILGLTISEIKLCLTTYYLLNTSKMESK